MTTFAYVVFVLCFGWCAAVNCFYNCDTEPTYTEYNEFFANEIDCSVSAGVSGSVATCLCEYKHYNEKDTFTLFQNGIKQNCTTTVLQFDVTTVVSVCELVHQIDSVYKYTIQFAKLDNCRPSFCETGNMQGVALQSTQVATLSFGPVFGVVFAVTVCVLVFGSILYVKFRKRNSTITQL